MLARCYSNQRMLLCDVTDAHCYCEQAPCQRPKLATGEGCSQLPVATVNLKLLYFFASEIPAFYCIKIYMNNLVVRIDTSATSSYTPAYTNIAIYFISTAYTTTTMHTHKLLIPF
jgi:hypothetical protein